jgi:hypothetical protein
MNNLFNIGFRVKGQQELLQLVEKVLARGQAIAVKKGRYVSYSDPSGAEIWLQLDEKNYLTGLNPHFKGKSRRQVGISVAVPREKPTLDFALHGWADPMDETNPENGAYPFVFDLPDGGKYQGLVFPQIVDVQLTAFAHEMEYYPSEEAFNESQEGEMKWASMSFVPTGLFKAGQAAEPAQPEAIGLLTGLVREVQKKQNQMTGEEFYWFWVETLGGEVDVVADLGYLHELPKAGGVVQGQFWLSGRIISKPKQLYPRRGGFFSRLFGKN